MMVAPNCHALVPSETTTGLLPAAGSVVELLDGSLVQPPIITAAEIAPMMIAFFMRGLFVNEIVRRFGQQNCERKLISRKHTAQKRRPQQAPGSTLKDAAPRVHPANVTSVPARSGARDVLGPQRVEPRKAV